MCCAMKPPQPKSQQPKSNTQDFCGSCQHSQETCKEQTSVLWEQRAAEQREDLGGGTQSGLLTPPTWSLLPQTLYPHTESGTAAKAAGGFPGLLQPPLSPILTLYTSHNAWETPDHILFLGVELDTCFVYLGTNGTFPAL